MVTMMAQPKCPKAITTIGDAPVETALSRSSRYGFGGFGGCGL